MTEIINANPIIHDVSQLGDRGPSIKSITDKATLLARYYASLSLTDNSSPSLGGELPVTVSEGTTGNSEDDDDEIEDVIDAREIFDLISTILDPEHPLTLAQLAVVNLHDIAVSHSSAPSGLLEVLIKITPTITHCSLATLIGLGIRVRLERCLPPRFRIRILIKEGSHQLENQVNKQLNDKERVAAACENNQLLSVILQMLSTCS